VNGDAGGVKGVGGSAVMEVGERRGVLENEVAEEVGTVGGREMSKG